MAMLTMNCQGKIIRVSGMVAIVESLEIIHQKERIIVYPKTCLTQTSTKNFVKVWYPEREDNQIRNGVIDLDTLRYLLDKQG